MKNDSLSRICLTMLLLPVVVWATFAATAQNTPHQKPPYATGRPMPEPSIFAEGIVSTRDYESGITFTPDGKTIYFVKSTPDLSFRVILVSNFDGRRWSAPEVAPFSGQYSDTDPCLSPDGIKLFFASRRPVAGSAPKADTDLWMVEKTSGGWSEARHLDATVNSESNETSPSVTTDGTLYFSSNRAGGKGAADIYRARFAGGRYAAPENLGESVNTPMPELQVFVVPDASVLIFAAAGRDDGHGGTDLYLSRWKDGAWMKASNLGGKINSGGSESAPRVSPDGRYLFWTSTRGYGFGNQPPKRLNYRELSDRLRNPRNSLGDIYQIDIRELPLTP